MNYQASEWAESYYPLYSGTVDSLHCGATAPTQAIEAGTDSTALLIAIAAGKGSLEAGGQIYTLTEGEAILLPPHCRAVLTTERQQPLQAYRLAVQTQGPARVPLTAWIQQSAIGLNEQPLPLPDEPTLLGQLAELHTFRSPANEARHLQNQILLHQVLLYVLNRLEAIKGAGDQPSLERSIHYMERHYAGKIKRESLAAMAGMSLSHYSYQFKQRTGFSPNEYLSRLRVNRAKELIIAGGSTLREIAHLVGYKDEFYLSRRFKQQAGTSPSGFAQAPGRRVAVFLAPYVSHLLQLGVPPAAAIVENNEYVSTDGLELPHTTRLIHADHPPEQLLAFLRTQGIDIIIAAGEHVEACGLTAARLRAIAPLIDISWMQFGWKDHFRLIARAVNRSELAEKWLSEFEAEELEARRQIAGTRLAAESITVLVCRPESIRIYGARNVGYVLYHSLGLHPSATIAAEIARLGEQFHSIPIEAGQLGDYVGDRLLVLPFPDAKGSFLHLEQLMADVHWQQLPAVRNGKVHRLDQNEWVPYNPVSLRLQLHRAIALFAPGQ